MLRRSLPTRPSSNRRHRRRSSHAVVRCLHIEPLEERTLLAAMVWENRGNLSDDSDNFNATYGVANAPVARAIVDQALIMWGQVLEVIETLDGPVTSWVQTISAADLGGNLRGGTDADGDITMDDDAGGSGWYFDPQPGDSSEFTTILSPFLASGGPAGADFFRTIVHELGHALGINPGDIEDNAPLLTGAQVTDAGTDQFDGVSSLLLLTPANEAPLITFTTAGSLHVYEGPPDPNFPAAPVQPFDLMNNGRTVGNSTRQLISDLDSLIMYKAFGDASLNPAYLPNYSFHAQLNLSTAVLTVYGDLDPANQNDQILLTEFNGSLVVIGAAFSVSFPLSSINQVVVQTGPSAGDGNDTITIDLSSSNWIPQNGISVDGGAGNNTLEIKGPVGTNNSYTVDSNQVLIPGCSSQTCSIGYTSITDMSVLADLTSESNTMLVNGTDASLQQLILAGGDMGKDTITVFDTDDSLQSLEINAMDGPDLVTIENLGNSTALTIDPGAGNDWIQFTPSGGDLGVLPAVTTKILPSPGEDLLLLQDDNAASTTSVVFDVDFSVYPGGEGIITRDGASLLPT